MGNETLTPELEAGRERILEQDALRRAALDPLPGPLKEAFLPKLPLKLSNGMTVRQPVAWDFVIMEALNSPMHLMRLESAKDPANREAVKMSNQDDFELAYQFTHSIDECEEVLEQGREKFAAAASAMAHTLTMKDYAVAIRAIVLELFGTEATYVPMSEEAGNGEPKKKLDA